MLGAGGGGGAAEAAFRLCLDFCFGLGFDFDFGSLTTMVEGGSSVSAWIVVSSDISL